MTGLKKIIKSQKEKDELPYTLDEEDFCKYLINELEYLVLQVYRFRHRKKT